MQNQSKTEVRLRQDKTRRQALKFADDDDLAKKIFVDTIMHYFLFIISLTQINKSLKSEIHFEYLHNINLTL